eukprot:Rhum_TRINITY_DN24964_c0_g1::Rhum_TRINITY_DN24964_c0_g1_i1::g.180786::m.180786
MRHPRVVARSLVCLYSSGFLIPCDMTCCLPVGNIFVVKGVVFLLGFCFFFVFDKFGAFAQHLLELRLELAARGLDDLAGRLVAGGDARGEVLALAELGEEAAHEGVAGSVRVDDVLDLRHGVRLDVRLRGHDRLLRALREHDRAGLALLGQLLGQDGDLLHVLRLPLLRLGERDGLRLVTEQDVGVLEGRVEDGAEEVDDERGGQVHREHLVVLVGVRGHVHQGRGARRQEEARDVVHLRLLDAGGHRLALHVLVRELGRGGQVGDEGALLVDNDDGARARGGLLRDGHRHGNAVLLGAGLEEVAVLVRGDAARVRHELLLAVGHPRGHTRGVQRGAARDVHDVGLGGELVVQGHVLLLGEDGVSALELVLLKEGGVSLGGDVQEGVTHAEELLDGHFRN